ncbi:Acyl carrier protein [bacterium HR40]|nr:Acyl carrier protein [bacterium HR40]
MTAVPDEVELFSTIRALLSAHNSAGIEIRRDTDLAADLSIDSVAAMDLVMEIEERYDLDIPVNEISELRTVGDLVDLVRRQIEERRG